MKTFLVNLFGDIGGVVVMSIFPLIELKGGIVFARSVELSFFEALALSYVGSTIIFIPVFFLLVPILNLLKRIKFVNKFALKIEEYFKGKAQDTLKNNATNGNVSKSEVFYKCLGVFIFVAIPLPMTGVWTGTAIAVFLGLKFKEVIFPIMAGNLVAGVIISLLAELCIRIWNIDCLDYILWGLLALAVVILVLTVLKISRKKAE